MTETPRLMVTFDKPSVLTALDLMGRALAEHRHMWSAEEREAYDAAVKSLTVSDRADHAPCVARPSDEGLIKAIREAEKSANLAQWEAQARQ